MSGSAFEAHEASHIVPSTAEHGVTTDAAQKEHEREERFRKLVALWVAALAVFLAVTAMAHEQASRDAVLDNIHASDTYNFFQAKNIRQTSNQIAADQLQTLLAMENPPEPLRSELEARLDSYEANVARYESEPATGEGKQELLVTARDYEASRDEALEKAHSFIYGQVLLQIAIVLGSVAILALHRGVLVVSGLAALVAMVFVANGHVGFYHLAL
ncbi:MAG TPA: DUF4337 domain-containing protein [Dehalococcoidia bacterium]|nr:DUF4337 domain-containing protein [Dehalococcoidia bacterium]